MPQIIYSQNPLKPSESAVVVGAGTNLLGWLTDNGYMTAMTERPMLVILNGIELMQADYDVELCDSDVVVIAEQMEGLDPFTIFLIVAFVASAALYLTMPTPENPNTDTEQGSPTYSVSSRGNKARMEQPKPVIYGEMVTYPDLSAESVSEFDANNDQIVSQLFELSMGELSVDISTARFEDTLLTSFDDYEVEIIPPGQKPTLFPSVIVESSEVSNLDLTDAGLGPYAASDIATEATTIAVDMSAPAGIYSTTDEGGLASNSVKYQFSSREIDDLGSPIGPWVVLGTESMRGSNRDPIRRTHRYNVAPGRYEVKADRITPENDSIRKSDDIRWVSLKAYIGETSITNSTRVAVRVRASEQVGNRALSKFNLKSIRKLETWHPVNGWQAPTETRNPVWAFADACRADYGGKRSDAFIDLDTLYAYASVFDSEGVEFNGVFDTDTTLWDALTAILMPAKAVPVDDAGIYTLSRDEQKFAPVQMFTMRNIVRDSFSIENVGVLEDTSDSIRAFFFDKDQGYRKVSFIESLPGGTTTQPREVQLFGVTDKDTAHDLVLYMLAQNFYRRQLVKFRTGLEGRIPKHGDLIAVSHYMLNIENSEDSVSGDIVDSNGTVLYLSEDCTGLANPHIFIRNNQGEPLGPYTINVIDDESIQVTDGAFNPGDIEFKKGYELPQFSAGSGSNFDSWIKVSEITPEEDGVVQISGFIDAPEVYDIANGVPVPPIDQLPSRPSILPQVTELTAAVGGSSETPEIVLSWSGARSDFYYVEFSDDQIDYFPVGSGRVFTESATYTVETPGTYYFRVAGASILRGDWVPITVDTTAPAYEVPQAVTGLQLREAFTGDTLKVQWSSDTVDNIVEIWDSGVQRYSEKVRAQQFDLHYTVANANAIGREFDVRVYAVSLEGIQSATFATLTVSNPAPAGLNNLSVDAVIDNALITFDYPTDPDIAGVSVWLSAINGFTPNDTTLVFDRSVDPVIGVTLPQGTSYIIVAAVDVWGTDSLNYSGQFTVSGGEITETQIADDSISTPKLQANAVTASKISVAQLSAITADLGTATAGTFKTTAGTTDRFEASSAGDFPLWLGTGTKNATNGRVYYDKTTGEFVIRDSASGFFFSFDPLDTTYAFKMQTQAGDKYVRYNKATDTLELDNIQAAGDIEATSIKAGTADIIDTLMLQGQAVTISSASFSSGSILITTGTTVQSLTFTSTGNPVMIDASCVCSGSSGFLGSLLLYRNGLLVHTFGDNSSFKYSLATIYRDLPSAGPVTYELRATRTSGVGGSTNVKHRVIRALEVKR